MTEEQRKQFLAFADIGFRAEVSQLISEPNKSSQVEECAKLFNTLRRTFLEEEKDG